MGGFPIQNSLCSEKFSKFLDSWFLSLEKMVNSRFLIPIFSAKFPIFDSWFFNSDSNFLIKMYFWLCFDIFHKHTPLNNASFECFVENWAQIRHFCERIENYKNDCSQFLNSQFSKNSNNSIPILLVLTKVKQFLIPISLTREKICWFPIPDSLKIGNYCQVNQKFTNRVSLWKEVS